MKATPSGRIPSTGRSSSVITVSAGPSRSSNCPVSTAIQNAMPITNARTTLSGIRR